MKNNKKGVIKQQFLLFLFLVVSFIIGIIAIAYYLVKINKKNDSSIINYFDQINLTYEVCLKENVFFDEKCLNTDREYITTIIDNINLDFEYIFSSSQKINPMYNYEITTELVATEKVKSKKKIYEKKEFLIEKKEVVLNNKSNYIIKEKITINYDKYNQIMQELKKEYAILFDSKLQVKLNVTTKSDVPNISKKLEHSNSILFEIPLSEQMINLKRDYANKKTEHMLSDSEKYLETKKENKQILMYVFVFEAFNLILLTVLINKRMYTKNKFKMEIAKIMKEYDRFITIVDSIPNLNEKGNIVVSSFKELLDAREWLNKPILYFETNSRGLFIIINETDVYLFKIDK